MVATLLIPRQYTATGEFLLQDAVAPQGLSQLASQFGITPPTSGPSPVFYAQWVTSFEIVREVARTRYRIKGDQPFAGTLYDFFGIPMDGVDDDVKAVNMLRKHTRSRADRVTLTVDIEVTLRNRQLASAVDRRFLSVVSEFATQRRMSSGRAEREFVEKRLRDARDSLRFAEESLADFIRANHSYAESPDLALRYTRLQRDIAERQSIVQILVQSFEAARLQEVRDTPILSVTQNPEASVEPVRRGILMKGTLAFAILILIQYLFLGWYARRTTDA